MNPRLHRTLRFLLQVGGVLTLLLILTPAGFG